LTQIVEAALGRRVQTVRPAEKGLCMIYRMDGRLQKTLRHLQTSKTGKAQAEMLKPEKAAAR